MEKETRNAQKRIYLDTAAATPLDPRVFAAMRPWLESEFGNPSSLHREGMSAAAALSAAREKVARLLDAHADEIIFTSGGTEGDNLALFGVARALLSRKKLAAPGHIITSAIEHRAVLEAGARLEAEGWRLTYLPVDRNGLVDLDAFKDALSSDTVLVSIMYANNEIGTIEPVREIAKILRAFRKKRAAADPYAEHWPYFHTDACQAPRFLPLSVEKLGVDLMTLNGSKIYGPKGTGCLYARRNIFIEPQLVGGGQERGSRSGTENVPGIVGFAEALSIAVAEREEESGRLEALRDRFAALLAKLPGVSLNGHPTERLPNIVSATFAGLLGELSVLSLDARGIAASTGSACSAHHRDDAHVIMSLGHDRAYADETIRFSLARETTEKDLAETVKAVSEILKLNQGATI
jgi:cysteine desulfurase